MIRGNASEIRGLAGEGSTGSGVDVSALDVITEENLKPSMEMVRALAEKTGSVIAVSGVIDVISDGKRSMVLRNGCATMSRITGSGCMLTAMIAAYCGAMPEDAFTAACAAMAAMGVCGELAADPEITLSLLQMDFDVLSVSPGALLTIRDKIQGLTLGQPVA